MTRFNAGRLGAAGLLPLLLAACGAGSPNSVVFGQGTSVGLAIGQSPTTQAPEFVLGYRDANIAFLPTVAVGADGEPILLGGSSNVQGAVTFTETYSVLGQFEVTAPTAVGADGSAAGRVGLGKFFATGLAAQKLSAGFACALSDGQDSAHCHPPGATGNGEAASPPSG